MKFSRKTVHIIWLIVTLIAVAGMIAFTILPLITYG